MEENSSLGKWFNNHKGRRSKTQIIEAGLLRGNLTSYYFYRLRYFLVRSLLAAVIFSVELRILIEGFGKEFFTQSLGARTLVLLLTAFWWAGLEIMRADIRKFKRDEKPYIIPQIILAWRKYAHNLTLWVLAISTLMVGIWSLMSPSTLMSAYGFYVLTLIARILVDIPLRTYHSSVYATMRIYRPMYWIIATELVSFAMFLTLKPSIGPWSVGVASLVSLILSSSISYHYITQVYRFLGYDKSVEVAKTKKTKKEKRDFLPSFKKIVAQATPLTIFRLDAVLVLLLILGTYSISNNPGDSQSSYSQLILIAICMPLLYAAQEWSMLLYFDYKKLELRIFNNLRERFNVGLKYLIVLISICLWLLLPLLQFIAGQGWHFPPISVLGLLLSSSYLGQQAIRVFSLGSNKELLIWGISLLLSLTTFLVIGASLNIDAKIIWISIILTIHATGLNLFAKDEPMDTAKILMPPTEWLKQLKLTTMPWGGLIRIRLPEAKELDNTKFIIREAAQGIRNAFPGKIYMTCLSRTGLLFFGSGKALIDKKYPTDQESLYTLLRKTIVPLLPESLERMIILPITIDNDKFLANIAEGETKLKACLYPTEPLVTFEKDLKSFDFNENDEDVSVEDCREILSAAIRYYSAMDARANRMAPNWEVVCEEENGAIARIQAIPKKKKNGVSRWAHSMTKKNLWRAWNESQKDTNSTNSPETVTLPLLTP